jgi:hypothetical protein
MSLLQHATPVVAIRIVEVCWLGARMEEAGGSEAVKEMCGRGEKGSCKTK